ncbi:hypothetical protein HrrHm1_125 [Halorubrum virus Humcor1]|nr:hypothetical protein HrrHm1_125 [Halorubrum virus Humcor1]
MRLDVGAGREATQVVNADKCVRHLAALFICDDRFEISELAVCLIDKTI